MLTDKREIKFRVWNEKIKEMETGITLFNFCSHCIDENMTFMQYTGLKDKNGKEVYDGDIVRHCFKGIMEVYWCDELYWDGWGSSHPGFYLRNKYLNKGELQHSVHFISRDIKIIGNIYENPELLEEKNNGTT